MPNRQMTTARPRFKRLIAWFMNHKGATLVIGAFIPLSLIFRYAIYEPISQTAWHFDDASAYTFDAQKITLSGSRASLRATESWLGEWGYRRAVSIEAPSDSALTEYPAEIILTPDNFDFAKAKPDGSDLRVTLSDGVTLVSHWTEEYDSVDGRAVIYARVSELPAGESMSLYVYYGNRLAPPTSNWALTFGSELPAPTPSVIDADGQHNAFPGLVRLADGTLVATYRKASAHVSSDGRIMLARSTDGGQSWSTTLIYDDPTIDDRVDLGLTRLSDGTLIQPFYKHTGGSVQGSYILKSTDGGYAWNTPIPISNPLNRWMAVYGQVIELADGRLLLPAYGKNDSEPTRTMLLESSDRGDTWSLKSTIAYLDHQLLYTEGTVIQLNETSFMAIVRADGSITKLYKTVSNDVGNTWSVPTFFANGASPNLTRINETTLLYMAADRVGITGINARISTDNGTTWSKPVTLDRGNEYSTDLGYPAPIVMADGSFMVAYYKNHEIRTFRLSLEQIIANPNEDNLFEGIESNSLANWAVYDQASVRSTNTEYRSGQYSLELYDGSMDASPLASRPMYGYEQATGNVSFWIKPTVINHSVEFGLLNGNDPRIYKRFWLRLTPDGALEYNTTNRTTLQCTDWTEIAPTETVSQNQWTKFTLRFDTTTNEAEIFLNGLSVGLSEGCLQYENINRFGVAAGFTGVSGDHVFVDDIYTQPSVEARPSIDVGTEQTHYPTDAPSIVPNIGTAHPATALERFQEQAIKNGGEITYQLSSDNGATWWWWSGASWQTTQADVEASNTAATINSRASYFPAQGGALLFRAFLRSNGSQFVQLDKVTIHYLND